MNNWIKTILFFALYSLTISAVIWRAFEDSYAVLVIFFLLFLCLLFLSFWYDEIYAIFYAGKMKLPDEKVLEIVRLLCEKISLSVPSIKIVRLSSPKIITGNKTIYISQRLLDISNKSEFEAAVLHELIHLKRQDFLLNFVPFLSSRQIEYLVDAQTASICQEPEALISVLEKLSGQKYVKERIEHIRCL